MRLFLLRAAIVLAAAPVARAAAPRVVAQVSRAPAIAAAPMIAPAAVSPAFAPLSLRPRAFSARSQAVPAAAAPATPLRAAAARPSDPRSWDFSRWTLPKEESDGWTFRESWFAGARLWDGADRALLLGEGAMGSVFAHPARPDAVVKVARSGYADAAGQFMAPDDETVLAYEDYDLDRLAALGAAPRPLTRLTISGRPASVRERIHGETVAGLSRRGLFGRRELGLVHELIERIAAGGFAARDLNLGNIMIGRRAGDAEERAWLVDTLGVHPREGTNAERRDEMLAEPVPWLALKGFGLARPLGRMLDSRVQLSLRIARD